MNRVNQEQQKEGSYSYKIDEEDDQNLVIIQSKHQNVKRKHPVETANIFSAMYFTWLTCVIWKIFRSVHPPTIDDMLGTPETDQAFHNYQRLSRIWDAEIEKHGLEHASVWRATKKFIQTRFLVTCALIFVYSGAVFVSSSVIIRQLLVYVGDSSSSITDGLGLVAILLSVELVRASVFSWLFAIGYRTATRCRAALLTLVYEKVLTLPVSAGASNVGNLINICSNDGDRILEFCRTSFGVLIAPVVYVSGTVYVLVIIGPLGLLGSAIFIVILLLQGQFMKLLGRLRIKALSFTDERVRKINEILSSIKVIKMYGWERSMIAVVEDIRHKELSAVRSAAFVQSVNVSMAFLTPVIASVIMFSSVLGLGYNLTAEQAFTCVAIFNTMSFSLKLLPISAKAIADVKVSMSRIERVLKEKSLARLCDSFSATNDKTNAIEIAGATFCWPQQDNDAADANNDNISDVKALLLRESKDILRDVNVTIPTGLLIGVCGAVAAGKSSFISALMGHLCLKSGNVRMSGSVAYVAQQAWVMNATIQDNIVFGKPYDREKFSDVVFACCMIEDLNTLPGGDQAEVGESGVNLSGGQKQRISLARALYSDRDIYLLDNPLSAVDSHVSQHIFKEFIQQRLLRCGKTVILVTDQPQYLQMCSKVFFIAENSLTETDKDQVKSYSIKYHPKDGDQHQHDKLGEEFCKVTSDAENGNLVPNVGRSVNNSKDQQDGKLVVSEDRGRTTPLKTYYLYIKLAGGLFSFTFILFIFFLNIACVQFSNIWLSFWLKGATTGVRFDNESYSEGKEQIAVGNTSDNCSVSSTSDIECQSDFHFNLAVYSLSALVMLLVSCARGYAFVTIAQKASTNLHRRMLNSVVHAQMEFFHTNPTGRILNRFQKDTDELDIQLPSNWEMFFYNICTLLFAVGLIGYVFPKFLFTLIVIVPLFSIGYTVFKPAARETKRLDMMTRSGWFAHISATLTGLNTIRAYQQTAICSANFRQHLDDNSIPAYLYPCVNRWLAVRLDLITISISVVTSLLVIVSNNLVDPAFAGLALSSAFLCTTMLQFTFRILAEGEARFVTVDRIRHYIEEMPGESQTGDMLHREDWPTAGKIEFIDVEMRYRRDLSPALNMISFLTSSNEKLGIVGRTGSGKSSLAVALFRLAELNGGAIMIDGVDISTVALPCLRKRMSIIPQDPVMFTGTVRYNLDPFEEHNDSELWAVLEQTQLKERVSQFSDQLYSVVTENDNHFSAGESQLFCLARALLHNSRILILDEATSSVESETESKIQNMIANAFTACTVITIAHRLSTVTSCDRVMVMGHGKILELDTPANLLANKLSHFSQMMSVLD